MDLLRAQWPAVAPFRELSVFEGRNRFLFMGDDRNGFLEWQFGRCWTPEERKLARDRLARRQHLARRLGADFHFFIIPEKSVAYREHLPDTLSGLLLNPARPALQVQGRYLLPELLEAKPLSQAYETGGTHLTHWGGHVAYRAVCHTLGFEPLPLDAFDLVAEAERGDLAQKIGADLPDRHWTYRLRSPLARAQPVPAEWRPHVTRPIFVFEGPAAAPRAVIFRDSMSSSFVEALAQHFSRAVFLWRRGEFLLDVIAAERPDFVIHISTERFVSGLCTQLSRHSLIPGALRAED